MPKKRLVTFVCFLLSFTRLVMAADALDWRLWRGPLGRGSIEQGNYPVKFGAERFLWRAELPGRGCSTPIVLDEMIYLTSPVDANDALLCYDSHGSEKWRAVFNKEDPGKHRNGSGCNASPVTDGKLVFVYFKSGTFAAVDLDGKVRWKTDLVERFGKDTLFWDHGTSPVLTDRYVVMARMHQGESWLAAFDKDSGDIAWKVARNYSTPTECDHGYATPLVIQHNGKESILVWGAEHITIHDAIDGQVSWVCGNFNPDGNKLWPSIASPVIVGDMVVIAYGRNDRGVPRLHGIRLSGAGDVTETNHVWRRDDVGTFVPTPAVYEGRVILVRDRGEVACIDPATGKTVWEGAFPKHRMNFYASPLVAGDKLYAPREDGAVFVASVANDKFELLSENDMAESVIASPVPISKGILIRGERHLFCVNPETAPR
jgi:outer membrane protein assembly factor BamB